MTLLPFPSHPDSWQDLDSYLAQLLAAYESEPEPRETIPQLMAQERLRARQSTLRMLQRYIAPKVDGEAREAAEDGVEAAWKEAGYRSSIEVWQEEQR